MRKKELLAQNLSLYEQLQKAYADTAALKREIEKRDAEIFELKRELESQKVNILSAEDTAICATEPLLRLDEKIAVAASVDRNVEYGAEVIGRIVVFSTDYSNRLTAGGNTGNRELVNLILGRTEVAKSEILAITTSDKSAEEKKSDIDKVLENACEYFESVMAQLI